MDVGAVEGRIREVEGFQVEFVRNGRKIRSDASLPGLRAYPYERAAPGSWTVREWIEKRFTQHYGGFTVRVIAADGRSVSHGGRTLGNVRE